MKQLTLELKKRLLIVEFEDQQHLENVISCHKTGIRFMSDKEEPTKLICRGDELTEEIAETIILFNEKTGLYDGYYSPLVAFISSIEAQGYYWGENPVKRDNIQTDDGTILNIKYNSKEWQEAESKTFNPEKTLIFEILL